MLTGIGTIKLFPRPARRRWKGFQRDSSLWRCPRRAGTIHDKEGLHARPAGVINTTAKGFACKTTMTKEGQDADLKRIFAIMGLKVKCGDVLTITCDGEDEDAAIAALEETFKAV